MRDFEFMLTLASGFAPRPSESSAAGSVIELRQRTQKAGQRDERVALAHRDHVEGEVVKLKRAATAKRDS